jgi:hypothetical protein
MAGVFVKIPGTANIVKAKAARLAEAVQQHCNIVTAAAEKVRRPGAGDLARRSHHSNAELDSSGPSSGFSNGARCL